MPGPLVFPPDIFLFCCKKSSEVRTNASGIRENFRTDSEEKTGKAGTAWLTATAHKLLANS